MSKEIDAFVDYVRLLSEGNSCSIRFLSKRWGWSRMTTQRWLSKADEALEFVLGHFLGHQSGAELECVQGFVERGSEKMGHFLGQRTTTTPTRLSSTEETSRERQIGFLTDDVRVEKGGSKGGEIKVTGPWGSDRIRALLDELRLHWNSLQGPRKCRVLTPGYAIQLEKKLKAGYTEELIKKAMTRYAELCRGAVAPGWGRWSMFDFLQRQEWMDKLLDASWPGIVREDKNERKYW